MTIAIGALYADGVIVGADTKVVFSDGSTTSGGKLFLSLSPERALFAIADASEDARASKTLGQDISAAFVDAHREKKKPENLVRKAMGKWHRSYGQSQVPATEFIVGKVIVDQWIGLYYCQPPSTVLWQNPLAIGRGARPVESLLGLLSDHKCPLKPKLLMLAYLMYVAKKEEGSACGGETSVMVLSKAGTWAFVGQDEMAQAEVLAREIHSALQVSIQEILGAPIKPPTHSFERLYRELSEKAEALAFPSLRSLEFNVWKRAETRG